MYSGRNKTIDAYKGILVVLMILAHVIQFLCIGNHLSTYLSSYVNLTTFSGFFFIFGFTNQIAYFDKDDNKHPQKKILNNAVKILIAYYISAFSYRFFISTVFVFSLKLFAEIIIFYDVPGYSEFLISFLKSLNIRKKLFMKPTLCCRNYILNHKIFFL